MFRFHAVSEATAHWAQQLGTTCSNISVYRSLGVVVVADQLHPLWPKQQLRAKHNNRHPGTGVLGQYNRSAAQVNMVWGPLAEKSMSSSSAGEVPGHSTATSSTAATSSQVHNSTMQEMMATASHGLGGLFMNGPLMAALVAFLVAQFAKVRLLLSHSSLSGSSLVMHPTCAGCCHVVSSIGYSRPLLDDVYIQSMVGIPTNGQGR